MSGRAGKFSFLCRYWREESRGHENGIVPIYEPNLEETFLRNIQAERLHFTTDLKEALDQSEIVFLALPTPPGEDGSADLSYVLNVSENIGKLITDYKVIVNKSTVPVGTADRVRETIAAFASVEFDVVSNPEFLREGYAVEDCMNPSRVVIGTSSERAKTWWQICTNHLAILVFLSSTWMKNLQN